MSAPDYNDPASKLRLKISLRSMPGAASIFALVSGVSGLGAILSMLAFVLGFLPQVESSGNPLWLIVFAAIFLGASRAFYVLAKLARPGRRRPPSRFT